MLETKICSRCKVAKPREEFNKGRKNPDGLNYYCKQCQREIHLANKEYNNKRCMENYYKKNPKEVLPEGMKRCSKCKEVKPMTEQYFGKLSKSSDGFKYSCKECRRKTEYEPKKKHYLKKQKRYYEENKDKIYETTKAYRERNIEWYRSYNRQYYKENAEKIKENSKKSLYRRIENDIGFKILQRLRKRMYDAVKGTVKSARTIELIGCSTDKLRKHLEKQFTDGMTWDNYGEWHVDHIIPCANFDFTKESDQRECFHYTNLQPLWAVDNIRKSNKMPGDL